MAKIAVCLSGQTRNFNDYSEQVYNDIHTMFGEHEYDLYGHTWDDQPTPNGLEKFTYFEKTNQDEISDWVLEDMRTFGTFNANGKWDDIPEYQEAVASGNMLKFVCDRSKGRLGQVVSATHCFKYVPENRYDVIVRYRWDTDLNTNMYIFDPSRAIDDFKIVLNAFINKELWFNKHFHIVTAAPMHYCIGNSGTIHVKDICFLMSPEAHYNVKNKNIKRILSNIFINQDVTEPLGAHSLWGEVLKYWAYSENSITGKIIGIMPEIWQPKGYNDVKENHIYRI